MAATNLNCWFDSTYDGDTLTLRAWGADDGAELTVAASGAFALVDGVASPGLRRATITDGAAGVALVRIYLSGVEIASGYTEVLAADGGEYWIGRDDRPLAEILAAAEAAGDATAANQTAILSAIAALPSSTGPGSRQLDYTVSVAGIVRPGVSVWVSIDDPYTAAGTVAGTLVTDDAGQVTFNLSDDVTYYLWRDSPAFNFTDPVQVRYSSSNARWERWNGSAWEAWS